MHIHLIVFIHSINNNSKLNSYTLFTQRKFIWMAIYILVWIAIQKMHRLHGTFTIGFIGRASLVFIFCDVTRFTPLLARLVQ